MATTPEVREELFSLCKEFDFLMTQLTRLQEKLLWCEKELHRRPPVKKAPPRKRPKESTPEAIREFAAKYPDLDNHIIAVRFGVNTARVSEALAGKRT